MPTDCDICLADDHAGGCTQECPGGYSSVTNTPMADTLRLRLSRRTSMQRPITHVSPRLAQRAQLKSGMYTRTALLASGLPDLEPFSASINYFISLASTCFGTPMKTRIREGSAFLWLHAPRRRPLTGSLNQGDTSDKAGRGSIAQPKIPVPSREFVCFMFCARCLCWSAVPRRLCHHVEAEQR